MEPMSVVRVSVEGPSVSTGTDLLEATVVLSINAGWHVNANPASDEFLIPTEIALEGGSPVEIVHVGYPEAERKRFVFSEVPLAVYEGDVRIPVTLRRPAAGGAAREVPLRVTFQSCDDSQCLAPVTVSVMLKLNAPDGS
jgi:DsbC/DsbD-like thiol-disulfide interchange protein